MGIKHSLERIKKYEVWVFENTNKIDKLMERSIEIEKKYK